MLFCLESDPEPLGQKKMTLKFPTNFYLRKIDEECEGEEEKEEEIRVEEQSMKIIKNENYFKMEDKLQENVIPTENVKQIVKFSPIIYDYEIMKEAIYKKAQLENTEKMESVMSKISVLFDDFSKGKEKLLLRASEREKNVTKSILEDISKRELKSKSTSQLQKELKMRLQSDSNIESKYVDSNENIIDLEYSNKYKTKESNRHKEREKRKNRISELDRIGEEEWEEISGMASPGSGMMSSGSGIMSPGSGMVSPGSGMMSPGSGMTSSGSRMMSPESSLDSVLYSSTNYLQPGQDYQFQTENRVNALTKTFSHSLNGTMISPTLTPDHQNAHSHSPMYQYKRNSEGNDYQTLIQDPYSPQFSISDLTDAQHGFLKNNYEKNILDVIDDQSAYEDKYNNENENEDEEEKYIRRNGTDDMYGKNSSSNSRIHRFNVNAASCCYIDFQTRRKNDEDGEKG